MDLAHRFEDAGADLLTFHPRVAPDRRARHPKWSYIGLIKQAVSIPVFGNGNVFDRNDARTMIAQTACDGIALGRMAVAKPWLFAEWTDEFTPDADVYRRTAMKMTHLLVRRFDPRMALKRFKKFSLYFAANFKFGHTLHKSILKATTMEAAQEALEAFFATAPELSSRPNLNLFN